MKFKPLSMCFGMILVMASLVFVGALNNARPTDGKSIGTINPLTGGSL